MALRQEGGTTRRDHARELARVMENNEGGDDELKALIQSMRGLPHMVDVLNDWQLQRYLFALLVINLREA